MNIERALFSFWSNFGIPAYDENSVPDNAKMPYITYEVRGGFFNTTVFLTANIWHRSSSWETISKKAKEIADFITRGGRMFMEGSDVMWKRRGDTWNEHMSDPEDPDILRSMLTVEVEFLD